MIAEDLQSYLLSTTVEQRVKDACFGNRYTAVMLEDGDVGLAHTYLENGSADVSAATDRWSPVGLTTHEALSYLTSDDGLRRTVGFAAATALVNRRGGGYYEADLHHVLSIGFQDRVGMVGHLDPVVAPVEKRARECVIFQRDAAGFDGAFPAEDAYEQLPFCDVAVITSATLVFGDADRMLEAAAKCREVALVGPSTPLVPEVFSPYGVTLLSGVAVTDGPGILEAVADCTGMEAFGDRIRKVNIRP